MNWVVQVRAVTAEFSNGTFRLLRPPNANDRRAFRVGAHLATRV